MMWFLEIKILQIKEVEIEGVEKLLFCDVADDSQERNHVVTSSPKVAMEFDILLGYHTVFRKIYKIDYHVKSRASS